MQRDSSRFREIVSILGRYGFGEIRYRLKKNEEDDRPRALKQAFEELGPSFIKIGQILSTRSDLLSTEYLVELEKLQEDTLPIPYDIIQQEYFESVGRHIEDDFATITKKPMASASIAQVHRAQMKSGEQVVVKVQRPEIEDQLIRDLNIFIRVVEAIPSIFIDVIINPVEILKDIKIQILEEIDFLNEAHNMLLFAENHRQRTTILNPIPYLSLSTRQVLIQEYIDGISIARHFALKEEGYCDKDISVIISKLFGISKNKVYKLSIEN